MTTYSYEDPGINYTVIPELTDDEVCEAVFKRFAESSPRPYTPRVEHPVSTGRVTVEDMISVTPVGIFLSLFLSLFKKG